MLGLSLNIARVWGIPIRIHFSFLILFVILWKELNVDLVTALIFAALLILSITLHELGHSFFALRYGSRVKDITITFIGGVARMNRIPSAPYQEIVMAAAGPAVSFILSGLLYLGATRMPITEASPQILATVGMLFLAFAHLNLILGAFNLIPAFPMDGGRIFRAALVRRKGRVRATRSAATLGRLFAWVIGLHAIFGYENINWLHLLVALFIHQAARQELMQVIAETRPAPAWPFGSAPVGTPIDQVVVGPAPYERGPATESDVFRDKS